MLVKDWMSRKIITIDHDQSLSDAIKTFQDRFISTLPVMKKDKVVGIITDGDVKKASPSNATTLDKFEIMTLMDKVTIRSVMSSPVIFTRADRTIDETAAQMLAKSVSAMPVLDSFENLEGIITKSDIFRCFVSFTGMADTGQMFMFRLKDRPGVIKNLLDMIQSSGGRLRSVLTSYDDKAPEYRKVFIHTFGIEGDKFDNLLQTFSLVGGMTYAADMRRNIRMTY